MLSIERSELQDLLYKPSGLRLGLAILTRAPRGRARAGAIALGVGPTIREYVGAKWMDGSNDMPDMALLRAVAAKASVIKEGRNQQEHTRAGIIVSSRRLPAEARISPKYASTPEPVQLHHFGEYAQVFTGTIGGCVTRMAAGEAALTLFARREGVPFMPDLLLELPETSDPATITRAMFEAGLAQARLTYDASTGIMHSLCDTLATLYE